MDELTSILLSSGLGFLGALIDAGITWWVTDGATNTQTTFDLYRELNSEPLLISSTTTRTVKLSESWVMTG